MTKAEIIIKIADKLGLEKVEIQHTVESFMDEIREALAQGDHVFLRGFGSFIIKHRAEKKARNITKNTTIKVPAHNIPAFKPGKEFVKKIKDSKKIPLKK